jgi:hypothetical protein
MAKIKKAGSLIINNPGMPAHAINSENVAG